MSIPKILLSSDYEIPELLQKGGWGADFTNLLVQVIDLLNSLFIASSSNRRKYPTQAFLVGAGTTLAPSLRTTVSRIAGSGGPVTLNATTAIADGEEDGQLLILIGTNDTNTVTINDAANTDLGAATRVLALGSALMLIYNSTRTLWEEVSFKS